MKIIFQRNVVALKRFARRIGCDVAGNTLAIVAAAIIPLAALVGAGIDMSRAYMAQARLQMACDAGALAGRRVMSAGTVDDTVRLEAQKFFRFNFPTGEGGTNPAFGVTAFAPVIADGNSGTVTMTAETTVPTTIMSMFGYSGIPIKASCYARQDFVNTDILLVLDTTGSMAQDVSGTNVSSGPTSKIVALRAAVLALYDELKPVQDQLAASGLRLRYGIVPYSSSVNVGKQLRAANTSWVDSGSTYTYQSRRPVYWSSTVNSTTTCYRRYGNTTCFATSALANSATSGTDISSSNCNKYGSNEKFGNNFNPSPAGSPTVTGAAPTVTRIVYSFDTWNGGNSGNNNKKCVRKEVATTHSTSNSGGSGMTFFSWEYVPMQHSLATYVTGSETVIPTETDGSKATWAGCIEERKTVSTITAASGLTIPSDAYDLNIDMRPSSTAGTKWAPYWPEVEWRSNGAKPQVACPQGAKRLQTWARADLSTYLDTLFADGGTYHDIGMIWGARFISPDGLFKAGSADLACNSTDAGNSLNFCNMPVTRYIIFMTDGLLDTGSTLYSSYGLEAQESRVSGTYSTDTDLDNRHRQRFKMACQAAKGKAISIWVVAFASVLDTDLTSCASSPNQASTSANSTQLTAKFVEIGKNIGALRLTQ